jgi:hypothetical protein
MGGRQTELFKPEAADKPTAITSSNVYREPRLFAVNENELYEHEEFLKLLKDPLWKKIS